VIEKTAFGVVIERFSTRASEWAGSTTAFIISLAVVLAWLATGPLFAFSDTWQLVINTITSVATFVMVFLIQRAQNKDSLAMHLKLSELIAAVRGSADRMMVVEELTEAELRQLHAHYLELVQARKTDQTTTS
jgi:low affinity Fe/Cu permease